MAARRDSRGWFSGLRESLRPGRSAVPTAPHPASVGATFTERDARDYELRTLEERIAELEAEDRGWLALTDNATVREFARTDLDTIIGRARRSYLKNPLINRAVNLQAYYVWAQGVTIRATDDAVNAVVQAFLDDPKNRAELTAHAAHEQKEIDLQNDGNIFFILFTDAQGRTRVRTLPVDEVREIISDPEDAKTPRYYKRQWSARRPLPGRTLGELKPRTAYYPDMRYRPVGGFDTFADGEVMDDTAVYHIKVGGLGGSRWGVPETYAALDWARAHQDYLTDFAAIMRSMRRFAWDVKTTGGAGAIAKLRERMAGRIGAATNSGTTTIEGGTGTPPTTGAAFISQPGTDAKPIHAGGAVVGAADNRYLLHQVAAATGWGEFMFGNAETSNYATSKTLDRPSELKITSRRALWADVLRDVLTYVVERAALIAGSGIAAREEPDADDNLTVTLFPEARREADARGAERTADIEVSYPSILEHDTTEMVNAWIAAATLNGKQVAGTVDDRTLIGGLLRTLGVAGADLDALLDKLAPEDGESEMERIARDRQARADAIAGTIAGGKADAERQQAGGDETPPDPTREALIAAARDLREALTVVADTEDRTDLFLEALHEFREALAAAVQDGD